MPSYIRSRQFHRNDYADGYSTKDGYRPRHLHPDGVAYLKKLGYQDEETISPEDLSYLRDNGWLLKTKYSRWDSITDASSKEYESKGLPLLLHLAPEPKSWELHLRLPEILKTPDLRPAALQNAALLIGDYSVDAFRLWPGSGAQSVPVTPREDRYDVRTHGTWPTTIDTQRWCRGAEGLDPQGAVFTLVQSEWRHVERGGDVFWDQDCLILRRATDNLAPLPTALQAEEIDTASDWHLLHAHFPAAPDMIVTEWCQRRGLAIHSQPWTLSLVTPPIRITAKGIPVFAFGTNILIIAQLSGSSAKTGPLPAIFDNEVQLAVASSLSKDAIDARYLLLTECKPGDYCLRFEQRRSASLAFVIEKQLDSLRLPPRLSVTIGDETIEGWSTGRGHDDAPSDPNPLIVRRYASNHPSQSPGACERIVLSSVIGNRPVKRP